MLKGNAGAARLVVAALLLALAGCGGGGGGGSTGGGGTGTTGGGGGGTGTGSTSTLLGITVTPANAMVKPGATQQMTATGSYYTCTTTCTFSSVNITSSVAWSTSNSGVATITSTGLASGVAVGSATITATYGGAPGTATFSVTNWTTRAEGPRGGLGGVAAIAYDGKHYTDATGYATSSTTDLVRWTENVSMADENDVIWNGSATAPLFVNAGFFGINYSTDGVNWSGTSLSSSTYGNYTPTQIAYSSTLPMWVAVAGTQVFTSKDGMNWSMAALPMTGLPLGASANAVTWTGTQFVLVGTIGTVFTSPDGVTWTVQNPGTTQSFYAVASNGSLIAACANNSPGATGSAGVYTSTDGIAWTFASSAIAGCTVLTYANGQWVASGSGMTGGVATSTNGSTWVTATTPPAGWLNSMIWDGKQYVGAGADRSGFPVVFTSASGAVWSAKSIYMSIQSIARNPATGLLVAMSNGQFSMASGDNGVTWQYGVVPAGAAVSAQNVTWAPALNEFIATAGGAVYASTDGLNWTALGTSVVCGKIESSPTLLVEACLTPLTSTNGTTWTAPTSFPSTQSVNDVFWTGTQWVALGSGGDISTSPDGLTWTKQTSNTTNSLNGFATSGTQMVAVGANGTIITSTNGATWTAQTSSAGTTMLNRVVWTGTQFVAIGQNGVILDSPDGVTWTSQPCAYTNPLFASDPYTLLDIIQAGTSTVMVGSRGLVATSP